jgi:hypothetical protein
MGAGVDVWLGGQPQPGGGAEHDQGQQHHRGVQAQHGGGDRGGGKDHGQQPARLTARCASQPVTDPTEHSLGIGEVGQHQDSCEESDGRCQGAQLGQRSARGQDAQGNGEGGGGRRNGRLGQPAGLDHGKREDRGQQTQRHGLGRRTAHRAGTGNTATPVLVFVLAFLLRVIRVPGGPPHPAGLGRRVGGRVSGTARPNSSSASRATLARAKKASSYRPRTMITPARVVLSAAPMPCMGLAAPNATL